MPDMNESKKGAIALPTETMIVIIMIFVGFIVVVIMIKNLMGGVEEATVDLVCKASVVARANSVIEFGGSCAPDRLGSCIIKPFMPKIQIMPLLCKTKKIEVSGTKYDVMKGFASMMQNTWSTFSEGKFSVTIEDKGKPSDYGDTCFPTYVVLINKINMDKKELQADLDKVVCSGEGDTAKACEDMKSSTLKENKGFITAEDFYNYLKDNNIRYLNVTETYYDYLTQHDGVPGRVIIPPLLLENHAYYVMYSDPGEKYAGKNPYNGVYVMDVDLADKIKTWHKNPSVAGLIVGGGLLVISVVISGGAALPVWITAAGAVAAGGASLASNIQTVLSKGEPCQILTGYGGGT